MQHIVLLFIIFLFYHFLCLKTLVSNGSADVHDCSFAVACIHVVLYQMYALLLFIMCIYNIVYPSQAISIDCICLDTILFCKFKISMIVLKVEVMNRSTQTAEAINTSF